jgi:hypothetical protein
MDVREVFMVLRQPSGDIAYVLGPWGASTAADAISAIESGRHRYRYRAGKHGARFVIVRDAQTKYLRLLDAGDESVPPPG